MDTPRERMTFIGALVGCLLITGLNSASPPLHASCKLTWTFSRTTCDTVHKLIIRQMRVWKEGSPCGNSEKCGYKITSIKTNDIKGTHTTPVHKYVDDLTMTFQATSRSSCIVDGYSSSELSYALLDFGTNYCNLHNLVVGSGLTNHTFGFKEATSDDICTQYSSADCNKY